MVSGRVLLPHCNLVGTISFFRLHFCCIQHPKFPQPHQNSPLGYSYSIQGLFLPMGPKLFHKTVPIVRKPHDQVATATSPPHSINLLCLFPHLCVQVPDNKQLKRGTDLFGVMVWGSNVRCGREGTAAGISSLVGLWSWALPTSSYLIRIRSRMKRIPLVIQFTLLFLFTLGVQSMGLCPSQCGYYSPLRHCSLGKTVLMSTTNNVLY